MIKNIAAVNGILMDLRTMYDDLNQLGHSEENQLVKDVIEDSKNHIESIGRNLEALLPGPEDDEDGG